VLSQNVDHHPNPYRFVVLVTLREVIAQFTPMLDKGLNTYSRIWFQKKSIKNASMAMPWRRLVETAIKN
jgi:hypothetical protein